MGNGERSGSGGRSDWPVRVAGMVGGAAGAAVGLLVATWADFGGLWPGLVIFLGGTAVGIVLGQLAGRLLFRPSSSGPPDGEKGAS